MINGPYRLLFGNLTLLLYNRMLKYSIELDWVLIRLPAKKFRRRNHRSTTVLFRTPRGMWPSRFCGIFRRKNSRIFAVASLIFMEFSRIDMGDPADIIIELSSSDEADNPPQVPCLSTAVRKRHGLRIFYPSFSENRCRIAERIAHGRATAHSILLVGR